MKRAASIFASSLLALCALTGCSSLVPFTQEIRTENALQRDDVKNLQFYLSHRITLRREIESGGSRVTSGHKLIVVSGKTIEEVEIAAKTPGVVVAAGDRTLTVSFEPGTSLVFALSSEPGDAAPTQSIAFAEPPEPFPGNGRGDLSPELKPFSPARGSGSYWLSVGSNNDVVFEGRSFVAVDDSVKARLLIDAESLRDVSKSEKVLGGVRLAPH